MSLESIILDRPLPLVQQISVQVRALIQEGKFPVGSKLPPTAELARMWGSDVRTVHYAMTALVKEGLLARKPGSGSIVRSRSEKLTQVALYCSHETLGFKGSRYIQALQAALAAELRNNGLAACHWVDPRTDEESGGQWEAMTGAARRREFQAVIGLSAGLPQLAWLSRLPVPSAFHCSGNIPNKVVYDSGHFAELTLKALARRGCRSVGLISPLPTHVINKSHAHHPYEEFYGFFVEKAGECGIEIRNEWMRVCHHENSRRGLDDEHFGYEEFRALWKSKRRPNALVIYPDSIASGVLMAIAERGVRVPRDLKLVIHKNAGVNVLCPHPADYVVSDEREVAAALVSQIKRQSAGEKVLPEKIRFRLIATDS